VLIDAHAHVIPGSFPAAPAGCDPASWPSMSAASLASGSSRLLAFGALRFTARAAWFDAERRLAAGDSETAQKLAQQALDGQEEDSGRALFILAEIATQNRDMEGARKYFEQALQIAHEPKVIAWSHIYLGRIFDLREDRFAAVDQYRAALDAANGTLPEAKLAAQKGLEQPYEPPVATQPQ